MKKKAKEILDDELKSDEDIYAFENVENPEEKSVQSSTQFIQIPAKR